MENKSVKKITGVAMLIAIEIILQVIGNYLAIGPINLNLALIPIALCAIMYGPLEGAMIGFMNGLVVLFSPSTQALFFVHAPFATAVVCLLKCTLAGLVSGLVYKLLKNKNNLVAVITASLLVPLINTGLFALGAMSILSKAVEIAQAKFQYGNMNFYSFLFLVFIGWNFIFEFGITAVLSPTINKLINIINKDK